MATKISTISFLQAKKQEMKENVYRRKFDNLVDEIDDNLVNTTIQRERIDESVKKVIYIPTVNTNGATDWAVLPQVRPVGQNTSRVPRSAEPIGFSKILVAASAIASSVPDGQAFSVNKIKARLYYELWKRSWALPEMNGFNTLSYVTQDMLTYGWSAWRVFPKQTIVDKTHNGVKTKKVIFDDIYREPLEVKRTWIGLSYRPAANDNRPEVLYEIDITKESYEEMKRKFGKRSKKGDLGAGVSMEAVEEDSEKVNTHVTITFYESPLQNRYIIASDSVVFYDGEMPNEDVYGSVVIVGCFYRDQNDPHGVGLFEMMRGNVYLYNYINSLNAEQVEAEVMPLLFGSGMTGQGDMTYTRSPNKINPLPQGAKVEKVMTTGNVTLGINYANQQKQDIEDNTGVNNIVSGSNSETTLGATVILKEAALNRLIKPRNNLKQGIENDSCIFFSWIKQDQVNPRKFLFSSPEQVQAFMQMNPSMHHELGDVGYDEMGAPYNISVMSSQRIPVNFDFSSDLLKESDFSEQSIQEHGEAKYSISKSAMLKNINDLETPDQLGYDDVSLKVDSGSMLVPSLEIEKQSSAALFPGIQQSISIIYGLARQDPDQAKAQLKAFTTFMETQRENIYDYIPQESYAAIMGGQLAPTPEQAAQQMLQQMMQGEQGGQGPTSPAAGMAQGQPAPMNNMPQQQSPLASAMNASVGRAAKPGQNDKNKNSKLG